MDNRTGEMQVFLRVAETGSFSGAARQMQMTPSSVSKLIGRVEARLGVRLIERSTRRLALTAEGRAYYERSQVVLAQIDEIERDLTRGAASITGTLRISASVGLGIVALEPLLPAFCAAHPKIVVDLSLSDDIVDLYLDRTDVALRVGALGSSGLTALKLGAAPRKIIAAPDYLRRYGTPQSLEDLSGHALLGLNFRRSVAVQGLEHGAHTPLLANNGETLRRMAVAGMGLARMGEFHIREDLRTGALVEVLPEATAGDTEDVHAVFLGGERVPQRVRAFLDFTAPRLRGFLAQAALPAETARAGSA